MRAKLTILKHRVWLRRAPGADFACSTEIGLALKVHLGCCRTKGKSGNTVGQDHDLRPDPSLPLLLKIIFNRGNTNKTNIVKDFGKVDTRQQAQ